MSNKKPSSQRFLGNRNYLTFYNRHLREFFDFNREPFQDCKIRHHEIIYDNQHGYRGFKGSRWNSIEKSQFFHYVSRYSIHRLDLISENIPTKSAMEILNYYNLLKAEIKKYKSIKRTKIGRRKIYYQSVDKALILYKKIPISYEMSPDWIHMEEVQSWLITKKLDRNIDKDTWRFPNIESELINLDRLKEWNDLMIKLGLIDDYKLKFEFNSLKLFEKLIKLVIKEIMIKLLLKFKENINHGGLDITDNEIYQIIDKPKLFIKNYWKMSGFENLNIKPQEIGEFFKSINPQEPIIWQRKLNELLTIDDLDKINRLTEDDELDEKLFLQETEMLDDYDLWESRRHEHVWLTYLSTANKDLIKDSMYNEQEMMEIEQRMNDEGLSHYNSGSESIDDSSSESSDESSDESSGVNSDESSIESSDESSNESSSEEGNDSTSNQAQDDISSSQNENSIADNESNDNDDDEINDSGSDDEEIDGNAVLLDNFSYSFAEY